MQSKCFFLYLLPDAIICLRSLLLLTWHLKLVSSTNGSVCSSEGCILSHLGQTKRVLYSSSVLFPTCVPVRDVSERGPLSAPCIRSVFNLLIHSFIGRISLCGSSLFTCLFVYLFILSAGFHYVVLLTWKLLCRSECPEICLPLLSECWY